MIVREPAGQHASALVIAPVNTWQAYNPWGGKSLYDFQSDGVAAVKVSFNRPYHPAHTFLEYDLDLIRWLEREGYDVSYTTDVDVDSQPGSLLQHTLVMTAGHDEYWSKETARRSRGCPRRRRQSRVHGRPTPATGRCATRKCGTDAGRVPRMR